MPRRKDPTERQIKELRTKKLLVDSQKCVSRSRELIKGSRRAIDALRKKREQT